MFQIDERSLADGRTLITVQPEKSDISRLLKSGSIDFTSKDNKLWLTTPAIRQAFLTKQGNIDDLFDRIITAVHGTTIEDSYEFRDDQKFASNVEVGKNMIIRGNLSVLGETTTVDTPTMTIEDNIIELNKNEKSEGITLRNAGTAINRGTKGYARYLFSEDFGGFVLNNSANIDGPIEDWTLIALTENKDSFLKGDVRVKNRLYSPFARITDSLVVDQKTTTRDLEVTNTSIFGGETTFNNNVTINGVLTTNGQVNFKNTITAYKPATFQDVATFNANVTMNKQLTNNGLVTMNRGLAVHDSNILVDTGTLQVGGAVTFDSTLGVTGNTTINGALSVNNIITSTNTITGNDFLTQSHYFVAGRDGHGIRFWDKSDKYTIFMAGTAAGGQVEHAGTSDYNMYFKMTDGTNRGFVFANGANPITQIEGSGIIRTVNDIYSKNSRVLTQADEGEGNGIDADTVDSKHARDLLWRDGSLPMLGNLQMGSHRISFADNNDYLDFNDTANINGIDRGGLFRFVSDNDVLKSVIEAGVLKAGQVNIDNSNASINGLNYIFGSTGMAFRLDDAWLRINPSNNYTSGVYFDKSLIRTDNEIQIGDTGTILKANKNEFLYKGQKVLTYAGTTGKEQINGDINLGGHRLKFNAFTDAGTSGAADTDFAEIYAEHDQNTETSRLVLDIGDNQDDSIILRTNNINDINNSQKNSITVDYNKVTFSDNPYFGSNRILHTGDLGSGNHLDADTVDGKHYSDLVNDFVNANGDTINGTLTINGENRILFGHKNEVRAGGNNNRDFVISSQGNIYIRSADTGSTSNQLLLNTNGQLVWNTNEIVNKSMYGHGKGLDADTIDGQHLTDLDNRFVNTSGDMMTGDLKMSNGTRFIGSYNFGYMCFDSSGNPDYIAYIDDSNRVHLGYNNRPMMLDYDNPVVRGEHKIWHAGNHGHNSGLDADKIDGQHLTDLDNRFVNTNGDTMTGDLLIRKQYSCVNLIQQESNLKLFTHDNGNIYIQAGINNNNYNGNIIISGTNVDPLNSFKIIAKNLGEVKINDNKILTTADCGHEKGLDADTLDGRHGSDFADVNHNHNKQYVAKNEIDLENKYRILYDNSTNSLNFMYLG